MIHFECDYTEGAHPLILERLIATNMEQTSGYGEDPHCERAKIYIKEACHNPSAMVEFLVGGTQANTTVIASILRPYQGVIAADTGHINVHETGAIEATGHKVLTVPNHDGKMAATEVEALCKAHFEDSSAEHMVQPGMVYLSHPTETGMLYTKEELSAISKVCKQYDLPLFLDGARLGYGLTAPGNDLYLEDIANLVDVFYIGGTKVGALFGEAIVFTNSKLMKDFRYSMKQRGGLLAKGRLLGIQFETLFEGKLYYEISQNAIDHAMRIKQALLNKGIKFLYDSRTNQQFPILSPTQYELLSQKYKFSFWEKLSDTEIAVRICTSWATTSENVTALIEDITAL